MDGIAATIRASGTTIAVGRAPDVTWRDPPGQPAPPKHAQAGSSR
jgi:hypothetical protein